VVSSLIFAGGIMPLPMVTHLFQPLLKFQLSTRHVNFLRKMPTQDVKATVVTCIMVLHHGTALWYIGELFNLQRACFYNAWQQSTVELPDAPCQGGKCSVT